MNKSLQCSIYDAALGSFGIYPMSTVKDGVTIPRTEWQEGWNAAHTRFLEVTRAFESDIETMTPEQQNHLEEMIDHSVLFLYLHEGKVLYELNCNDMFAWGCADAEEIIREELEEAYTEYKANRLDLWISKRRGMQPQRPIVDMLKKHGQWSAEWEAIPKNPFDELCCDGDCTVHNPKEGDAN